MAEPFEGGRIGAQAADFAAAAVRAEIGTSLIARRIGPVYTTQDLTRWLTAPRRHPFTGEAVRKRAARGRLVAFRTDDIRYAFPAWQFDRTAGRLVPRAEVISLRNRLPHDGSLTDGDLAAWMNTRLASLQDTPEGCAHSQGADDPRLAAAVARLRFRAARSVNRLKTAEAILMTSLVWWRSRSDRHGNAE